MDVSMPLVILVGLIWLIVSGVKILQEYERGVVFRLGRLIEKERGPGIIYIIPFFEKWIKVDLRTMTMEIPPQEIITQDNVTVRVTAVGYFRVIRPPDAITKITNYTYATSQIAQTTLRSVLGQSDLDALLSQREKINQTLQHIIDSQTDPWGIKVSIVEVKDVELPENMKRAMAKQAEAERERRAKIIHAEGEFQASEKLAQASDALSKSPMSLQLRYLQTLSEISTEKNSTIIFPLPIDLMEAFRGMLNRVSRVE
ncbi:MAG: slipin family protein [bacterium]|nr:slipin family protein [bacterium]